MRIGRGRSIAQYGELFQGQIEDGRGELRRCLISLPCRAMVSQATFYPEAGASFRVDPPHKQKALRSAQIALQHFNASHFGGSLLIESAVPEAKGCGSSTADCTAAAVAVADALVLSLHDQELARMVVEAEVASDNFMFRRAVLFAHREGIVLEDFSAHIPRLEVLGFDTAPEDLLETLKYPPAQYSWRQIQSFSILRGALRRALREGDIRLLARVSSASARINEEFLPKRMFKEVREIAEHAGALGIAAAHSGTVLSILLDPADELLERKVEQIRKQLSALGISQVLRFQI